MEQPELGWTTIVTPIRAIDGDTVEVEITKRVTVRITDDEAMYNTPEIRKPASDKEILLGMEAKKELEDILFNSENVVLHIPTEINGKLQDIFSIGARVVGHIFCDQEDIAEVIRDLGYDKNSPNYLG